MCRLNPAVARRHDDERGAVLALALAFLAGFSVLIAVILSQASANLQTTPIVESRAERSLTADAGIEQTIQQLAIDPRICDSSTAETLAPQILNGRTATISCRVVGDAGFPVGGDGWAAIIKRDLDKQAGGTAHLSGPVYVGGNISNGSIENSGGSVFQYSPPSAPCSGNPLNKPNGLVVKPTPPYKWQCTNEPAPDPAHALPAVPARLNPAPTGSSSCKVFYPGKYTTAPALGNSNYFVSGVYYFEDIGNWTAGGTTVAGFNSGDTTAGVPAACVNAQATDATPGSGGNGYGVKWIFGGNSQLSLGNGDTVILHHRVPAGASGGSTGVSLQAVQSDQGTGGYKVRPPGTVINLSGGHPALTAFGLVYLGEQDVELDGPVGASVLPNGLVVRDVHIKLSNGNDEATLIGAGTSITGRRYVEITATASSPGMTDVVSKAVVEIRNKTSPPVIVVRTWRTSAGPAG